MATPLSGAGIGIFLVQEENGQIAANTPGGIELENLSLGDTYFYFDSVKTFEHDLSFGSQSDNMPGHTLSKIGTGLTGHTTGEGDLCGFTLTATMDETNGELLEKFAKLNNRTSDAAKYLVRQTATNTFRQFPNSAGTFKKYCPVTIMNCKTNEVFTRGNDYLLATLLFAETWKTTVLG
jgi:hypothetical protein